MKSQRAFREGQGVGNWESGGQASRFWLRSEVIDSPGEKGRTNGGKGYYIEEM